MDPARCAECQAELDLAAARLALEEYANPHNWTRDEMERWVFIDDDEPWARAADALAFQSSPDS